MFTIALVGIPFDRKSSFLQGAALAPARIRAALHNGAGNSWTELGANPLDDPRFIDQGDLSIADYPEIYPQIAALLAKGHRLISLGGDHSVTFPVIQAYAKAFGPIDILHVDAHGDLYHEFEGDPYSHACPFARIMESGFARRLVQVGIRTLTPHQREQAARFGVETIEMKDIHRAAEVKFDRPLYLSLDLDGLDPAFAPGVSHHEPGGLSTRQVLEIIHRLDAPFLGADIVEYNPHRDWADMTATLAAKLVKEIAGNMLG